MGRGYQFLTFLSFHYVHGNIHHDPWEGGSAQKTNHKEDKMTFQQICAALSQLMGDGIAA